MKFLWRRTLGETQGSEIAEAALVMPIMFMMILGVFWFGQAFRIYGTITHAAREGARAAVAPACTTCPVQKPPQNAWSAIQDALTAAKLDPNRLPANPSTPPNNLVSCTDGTTAVSCDSGPGMPTKVCVQENVQLSTTTKGGTGLCGISVSFQYPYQFWLPGTTLNKRALLLPAQAEMRTEQQ
jgi:Flp pilus assembly protein TadG